MIDLNTFSNVHEFIRCLSSRRVAVVRQLVRLCNYLNDPTGAKNGPKHGDAEHVLRVEEHARHKHAGYNTLDDDDTSSVYSDDSSVSSDSAYSINDATSLDEILDQLLNDLDDAKKENA